MWTPRVRRADLTLADPLNYDVLTLVERHNLPDTVLVEGDIEDLRPAFDITTGLLVVDDRGEQKFSGVRPRLGTPRFTKLGDGRAQVAFESDLNELWRRSCWPTPANAWGAQTTAYDVQTAVHETRILGYINRNAGPIASNVGGINRRAFGLRVPASLGRGTSGKTSARFNNLGQLVADLAEAANLRVTIEQTYDGLGPHRDVVIRTVPDYSSWAQFGDADSGGPAVLGDEWSYSLGAGPSVFLSAAGGDLENRLLTPQVDAAILAAWGYEELFIDQRGTTDAGEIAQGIATARADNPPTADVAAPIDGGELDIPVGAKAAIVIDGELVIDRIRQITTVVTEASGQETVAVTHTFGSPDAGLVVDQKLLRSALRRLNGLERTQ